MLTIEMCEAIQNSVEKRVLELFPENLKNDTATHSLICVAVTAAVAAIQEYDQLLNHQKIQ